MSKKKESKKDNSSPRKGIDDIRKEMKKMQREGMSGRPEMPLGRESLTSRMARMESEGPPGKMLKTMKELRTDLLEIRNYLKKILNLLEAGVR